MEILTHIQNLVLYRKIFPSEILFLSASVVFAVNVFSVVAVLLLKKYRQHQKTSIEVFSHNLRHFSGNDRTQNLRRLTRKKVSFIRAVIDDLQKDWAQGENLSLRKELALPRLLSKLRQASSPENNKWKKIDAFHIRISLQDPSVLHDLILLLHQFDSDLLLVGVQGLAKMDRPETLRPIVESLGSIKLPPPLIMKALEKCSTDLRPILFETLPRAERKESKIWLAHLLGRYEGAPIREVLKKFAQDPFPYVRAAAISSLGKVGTSADFLLVLSLLKDPVWFVRAKAATACGRLKIQEAIPILKNLTQASEWWLKEDAEKALKLFSSPEENF